MSKRKDKDTIKREVLENMRNDGTMNHLQSLYLSKIASIIKNTDGFDFLKPYKTIRTEKPYLIASQIVIQYFQKKSLDYTFTTISDESNDAINFSNSDLVADTLNIQSDGVWLNELLTDWNSNKSTIVSKNKSDFFKKLQERLNEVLPEAEKYIPKEAVPKKDVQSSQPNKQEELTQSTKSKSSQKSDDVFSKSEDEVEDIQINDEGSDNEATTPSNTKTNISTNQNANSSSQIEDADIDFDSDKDASIPSSTKGNNIAENKSPSPVKPNSSQPSNDKQEVLSQSTKSKSSQSSVDIFSKSEDDIEDIQISDEGSDNGTATIPTNTKTNTTTSQNVNSNSQVDDFDVDFDKESESGGAPKATTTNNVSTPNNSINADVPIEAENFSDDDFDDIIDIKAESDEDSFISPNKKNSISNQPQQTKTPTQNSFASSSVSSTTPKTKTQSPLPAKTETNLVTPIEDDEFDDFDDDIEMLGADNSNTQTEIESPKKQEEAKTPQKQEEPKTPQKENASQNEEIEDPTWSDADVDIDFDD